MKKSVTVFLRTGIVIIGVLALVAMIWFPLTEGRATNLDLLSIYSDPFILYGYLASIAFFIALYQAFKLLGYIGQNKLFSPESVKAVKTIKYSALILALLIVSAGVYIRIFHAVDDDPAGFLAMCIVTTFISVVIAAAAGMFEKKLRRPASI